MLGKPLYDLFVGFRTSSCAHIASETYTPSMTSKNSDAACESDKTDRSQPGGAQYQRKTRCRNNEGDEAAVSQIAP